MTGMHIGLFTDAYVPSVNGVVTSVETLKKALEQKGHTVYIVTVGQDSKTYDYNEKQALLRILDNWENLKPDISGSMLFVEDEIVAFIIGEKIDNDNLFIHFEKSSPGFRGVSQANNRLFLEQNNSVKYINFGQDFGLPELRRSMQENNPSGYIKKYYIYKVA